MKFNVLRRFLFACVAGLVAGSCLGANMVTRRLLGTVDLAGVEGFSQTLYVCDWEEEPSCQFLSLYNDCANSGQDVVVLPQTLPDGFDGFWKITVLGEDAIGVVQFVEPDGKIRAATGNECKSPFVCNDGNCEPSVIQAMCLKDGNRVTCDTEVWTDEPEITLEEYITVRLLPYWSYSGYTLVMQREASPAVLSLSKTDNKFYKDTSTEITRLQTLPRIQDGYKFMGFYTQEAGQGTKVIDADGNIVSGAGAALAALGSDDIQLWPYGVRLYIINLDKQNGTGGTSLLYRLDTDWSRVPGLCGVWTNSYGEGNIASSITVPARSRYFFNGYSAQADGSTDAVIDASGDIGTSLMNNACRLPESNYNLYAQWSMVPVCNAGSYSLNRTCTNCPSISGVSVGANELYKYVKDGTGDDIESCAVKLNIASGKSKCASGTDVVYVYDSNAAKYIRKDDYTVILPNNTNVMQQIVNPDVIEDYCIECDIGNGFYRNGNACGVCPAPQDSVEVGEDKLYQFVLYNNGNGVTSCALQLNIDSGLSSCDDGTNVIYTYNTSFRKYKLKTKTVVPKDGAQLRAVETTELADYCQTCDLGNGQYVDDRGVCHDCPNKQLCWMANQVSGAPSVGCLANGLYQFFLYQDGKGKSSCAVKLNVDREIGVRAGAINGIPGPVISIISGCSVGTEVIYSYNESRDGYIRNDGYRVVAKPLSVEVSPIPKNTELEDYCTVCRGGKYNVNGECKICNNGYYTTGTECDPETEVGREQCRCDLCPAGYYCKAEDANATVTTAKLCPANTYSQEGATECIKCPDGYSTAESGPVSGYDGLCLKHEDDIGTGCVSAAACKPLVSKLCKFATCGHPVPYGSINGGTNDCDDNHMELLVKNIAIDNGYTYTYGKIKDVERYKAWFYGSDFLGWNPGQGACGPVDVTNTSQSVIPESFELSKSISVDKINQSVIQTRKSHARSYVQMKAPEETD